MRLYREPASLEAFADEVLTPVQRLERLQAQMEALNGALKRIVECRRSLPDKRRHRHRSRTSAAAEEARFRRQARKLAWYAPS